MIICRSLVLLIFITAVLYPQEGSLNHDAENDLRYSVFGPPRPSVWEFQLSYMKEDLENVSTFNFYKNNQRNKTIFFKMAVNELNNRNEFRVKEITGGTILFPVNDDDRYQLDIGGTYDVLKGTSLSEKAVFSRITLRPEPYLWLRAGYELFDGYTTGALSSYKNTNLNSYYFAGKFTLNRFSVLAIAGRGKSDNDNFNRYGLAGIFNTPFNTYFLGGYIKSDQQDENVRTLALGRYAPFRPDGLPSGFVIWKHRESYDFILGGIFYGKTNLFVQPAAIGMSQGIFISSAALRENSELRQGKLMSITDDYRNSDITMFYVSLDQEIEMIPGKKNHIGFRAVQLYKIFNEISFSDISNPVIGLFYNEETLPEFNPARRSFVDSKTNYWSFQTGVTIADFVIVNAIYSPEKSNLIFALSIIYD
ncbi:MAG: hypothetical protein K9J16_16460 [Melioribacteraceae bacterium]|nr:hypothetical protein [Melioribacteraceae bacterium]MCF8356309.1 hypothetical protein [Melioribacteraceae bacterium]MCF8395735.1 hypothetical protein [Melioribacteraceae bacterium]MCF8421234.1 hypothetical protein [Melioribacteraceae bacterium]